MPVVEPVVERVCTITAKGQTTVPKSIRAALGVGPGGRIAFRIENGQVSVRAAGQDQPDQALAPFLALIEADLASHPARIQALDSGLLGRWTAAAPGAPSDPDASIDGDVAI